MPQHMRSIQGDPGREPEEAGIHDEIKDLAYTIEEKERKAELKERKKRRKRGADR